MRKAQFVILGVGYLLISGVANASPSAALSALSSTFSKGNNKTVKPLRNSAVENIAQESLDAAKAASRSAAQLKSLAHSRKKLHNIARSKSHSQNVKARDAYRGHEGEEAIERHNQKSAKYKNAAAEHLQESISLHENARDQHKQSAAEYSNAAAAHRFLRNDSEANKMTRKELKHRDEAENVQNKLDRDETFLREKYQRIPLSQGSVPDSPSASPPHYTRQDPGPVPISGPLPPRPSPQALPPEYTPQLPPPPQYWKCPIDKKDNI
jgi:hypothetical protein